MQTTAQFLIARLELATREHKLEIEEYGNIVMLTCSCKAFSTVRPVRDRFEGGAAHYHHCELMRLEEVMTTKALEAVKHMII